MFTPTEEIRTTCFNTGAKVRKARKSQDEGTAQFHQTWFNKYRDFEAFKLSNGDKATASEIKAAMETMFREGYQS